MSFGQDKGGKITGGAISDEVFASSDSVLQAGNYGAGQKGLQQWFSPEPVATLAHKIIGGRVAVLDPTAGNGSLLSKFDTPLSFGIEIDPDQIKNSEGSYNAIRGDFQHVYPLLRQGAGSWDGIVANPPFGLKWSEAHYRDGKSTDSTTLTFALCSRLLSENGQLVFVAGRDRFYRQVMALNEAKGIYAVIECDDMFEGVTIPCVMAFGINPGNRSAGDEGYASREVGLDMIDLMAPWVEEQREKALGNYNSVSRHSYGTYKMPEHFETIQKEHDRRLEGRSKKNREYDALLVGGKIIQFLPSAFAILALSNAGKSGNFAGLHGQNIHYFSSNERMWNDMLSFRDQGILTIEPKLFDAVEATMGEVRKERVPLYEVKPQQRLGFLMDIEYLRCKKDDTEKGFLKGDNYHTSAKVGPPIVETEKRIVESKKNPGEYVEKTFIKMRKALTVTIGHHSFIDSGEDASLNIKWLLEHFVLPDPGDISTRHPEEIAALETVAQKILDEFEAQSRVWEVDNPSAVPFTQRPFQKQDIARLAFKKGGLLTWEQGLGKTVGALLFMRMAQELGAKKVALVVTPNDLIDQWCRESQRFLGYQPTRIEGKPAFSWQQNEKGEWSKKKYLGYHGQAREIQQHVKQGGEGFWITHYEGICINGTRGKSTMLPAVTVREWEENKLVQGTERHNRYYWEKDGVCIGDDEKLREFIRQGYPHLSEKIEGKYQYQIAREILDDGFIQVPTKSYQLEDGSRSAYGYILGRYETITKRLTSRDLCPECESDRDNGWNGVYCESEKLDGKTCGYAHYAVRMKPIAALLSTTFQHGTIVLDEITKMQSDFSKTSKVLRGLRASWWLGLTGTPIKNYIDQAFWPLWRVLGNGSTRFPFSYEGGKTRFENDFAVVEYTKSGSRRENRKLLPEVSNLSMLWRLLASSTIRRRKEETGEDLVPKYYHEIQVPMGIAQAEQYAAMLKDFPKLFEEKYPEAPIVKAGMHGIMAPMLGLNWKLQYACAMPKADPDYEWFGVEGVSNYTPGNLKTLELAMALAKQGRKVLLGSVLKDSGAWYAERLNEKGVKALHILDDNGNTADAKKRAKIVYKFQTDDAQVLCAGVKAIRLGHNLDKADAVIINGLDFDYETLDQFVARIHRLTSQNPVDVFVILPTLEGQKTITTRIWETLGMKGASAELALDGRLIEKSEQRISEGDMIRDLMKRGFTVTDEAVDEVSVQESWEAIHSVETWDATDAIPSRPCEEVITTPEGMEAAKAVGAFLIAHAKGQVQLGFESLPDDIEEEALHPNAGEEEDYDAIDAAEAELEALEEGFLAALAPPIGPFMQSGAFFALAEEPDEPVITADGTWTMIPDEPTIEDEDEEPEAPTMVEIEEAVVAETIIPLAAEATVIEEETLVSDDTKVLEVAPAPSSSIAGEIRELKALLDEGILDADEFKEAKSILLARLKGGV
ncbi:MAG: hypothetical protein H0U53_10985 [Actinobacteria bacterium]|nr:hypothetical protein [Actinomycetota bacterium]